MSENVKGKMFGLHESQKDRHGFGLEDCHKVIDIILVFTGVQNADKGLVYKSKKRQT